mgnify:CR=1 FL=1
MAYTFNEDVFVVDCWTDTKEKEQVLKQLLNKLKAYGCPIVLCGHYAVNPEIVKLADYFLYIKDNDILLEKDFAEYGVNSERWTDMGSYKLTNKIDFHHDYAIWVTMKHAFKFAESLGKKYIHFLEYDNLPDEFQYRQAFMEYVRNYQAVVYEYDKDTHLKAAYYNDQGKQPERREDNSGIYTWTPWYDFGSKSIWGIPENQDEKNIQFVGYNILNSKEYSYLPIDKKLLYKYEYSKIKNYKSTICILFPKIPPKKYIIKNSIKNNV